MNRYFGTHTLEGEWHALLPRYLLLAERVRGSRVLDIGCGTGIGSSLLLELGAESVDGVDHRPEVLELARIKHDKQGLDFHVMFWEELDFPDDTFDVVVCLDPASPITDPNLLMEVRRVLRDGGEYICALERTKVAGLESLLPRYGYASSTDQVAIGQSDERVPQIGELSSYFDTIVSLVQRPHVSYVFEPDPMAAGADLGDANEMRRVPDEDEAGLWRTEDGGEQPSGPRHAGQWIPVDRHLSSEDAETAAVEIFFCGDANLPPAPLREIRLPYYNIVERLEQLIGDLQMRQSIGGEPSSFDEVLDEPADAEADAAEFDGAHQWDATPTKVHRSSQLPKAAPSPDDPSRVVELESQMSHLSNLYNQVRRDFDQVIQQTEAALGERDEYIDHLVRTIHQWEERYGDQGGLSDDASGFSETATTNVFRVDDLERPQTEPRLDELAETSDPDDIADQIASLEAERERIEKNLAAREARLAELRARTESELGDEETNDADASDDDEPAEESSELSEASDASEASDEAEKSAAIEDSEASKAPDQSDSESDSEPDDEQLADDSSAAEETAEKETSE